MCVCVSSNVARRATTVQEFHLCSSSADANVKLVIRVNYQLDANICLF